MARSLVRTGATVANAIIFEFASTNLVVELGLVLLLLLGRRLLTTGGPDMPRALAAAPHQHDATAQAASMGEHAQHHA